MIWIIIVSILTHINICDIWIIIVSILTELNIYFNVCDRMEINIFKLISNRDFTAATSFEYVCQICNKKIDKTTQSYI